MANIRDVAKKAGVGIATVSRCINNDGYVSEEVGKKIEQAIKELNYKPNALARAVFTKSSKMIGVIIPSIVNPFYTELSIGIENKARENGYSMVLSNTEYLAGNEAKTIEMFQRYRVDGIIAVDVKHSEAYDNVDVPIISVGKEIPGNLKNISSDNYRGGCLVADYVIKNNIASVLHIKGPDSLESARDRFTGFRDTLVAKGMTVDCIEGMYGEDVEGIGAVLKKYKFIFVWSDDLAISVLNECFVSGLNVPGDIEIVGFDDIYYSRKTCPPLTTVSQKITDIGEDAVEILIDKIEKKKSRRKNDNYDVELIFRGTTKKCTNE